MVQQVNGKKSSEVEYLDDLEKVIPGVEKDFHAAISNQVEERRAMGRAAVLRMSHPYCPDMRDPEHAQSSTSASSDSGSAKSPEGLLFESLGAFQKALKTLPRHCDNSTVPQFFDKQLIVLEDLGRDWVETIGKVFHVPPRVFALHWASPTHYKLSRARVPLGQPAEEHFVLPYSEILPFKIKEGMMLLFSFTQVSDSGVYVSNLTRIILGGHFFKLDCCSVRFVSSDMQQDQNADRGSQQESEATNAVCEAMISYWGSLGEQKEWTGRPSPRLRVDCGLHTDAHVHKPSCWWTLTQNQFNLVAMAQEISCKLMWMVKLWMIYHRGHRESDERHFQIPGPRYEVFMTNSIGGR